jgi:DNA-binding NtrC family response regulator
MSNAAPKIKILVAEDNEDFRRLLTIVLEAKGYAVRVVDNTGEAKEAISQSSAGFDLVISDIGMPGGGGLSLLEFVKAHNESSKFILMSGLAIDLSDPQMPHPDDFLMKPFRSADLLKMVEKMCHDRRHDEKQPS